MAVEAVSKDLVSMRKKAEKLKTQIKKAGNTKQTGKLKDKYFILLGQMGDICIEQGNYKEAEKVCRAMPQEGTARYNGLSRIFIETGRYAEAKGILQKALGKYPDNCMLINSMGLAFYRSGDCYEALRYFDRAGAAKDIDSGLAVQYNQGLALNCLGYYEEAYRVLADLLEREPEDPQYLVEMGYCCLQKGAVWEGIRHYRAAKDLGFEAPSVYGGLCCAYIEAGLRHEAYIIAREGVSRFPNDAGLYENYAETALDLGIFEQAQWAINEGLKLDPECEPLKKLQWDLDRQMGTKNYIEKPLNELLASGMNKKEMMQKAGDYLFKLEEEHPEYFLIGAHKRKKNSSL